MNNSKQIVEQWVAAFNRADVLALSVLYAEDAVNHQLPNTPAVGRKAITEMFRTEFAAAPEMHCIPVQLITEGEWTVLEWKDPKGFQGCGFFHVVDGLIRMQRGYWDKLSFNALYAENK